MFFPLSITHVAVSVLEMHLLFLWLYFNTPLEIICSEELLFSCFCQSPLTDTIYSLSLFLITTFWLFFLLFSLYPPIYSPDRYIFLYLLSGNPSATLRRRLPACNGRHGSHRRCNCNSGACGSTEFRLSAIEAL